MIQTNLFNSPESVAFNYQNANPFPYIVIDNFLDPWIISEINKELDEYTNWRTDGGVSRHQVNKMFTPDAMFDINDVEIFSQQAPKTRLMLNYLYSFEFLKFLETLTGISGLLPDYSFVGGGVHNVQSGGKLDIHADFGKHLITGLFRRINLLIYITPHWDELWGGELELWDRDMSKRLVKIPPVFNRAVIFNTDSTSFHGHPTPLNTPTGISRRSLALYYFTAEITDETNAGDLVNWQTFS